MQIIATLLPEVATAPLEVKAGEALSYNSSEQAFSESLLALSQQTGAIASRDASANANSKIQLEEVVIDTKGIPQVEDTDLVSFIEKSRNFRAAPLSLHTDEYKDVLAIKRDRQTPVMPIIHTDAEAADPDTSSRHLVTAPTVEKASADAKSVSSRVTPFDVEMKTYTPIIPVDQQAPVLPIDDAIDITTDVTLKNNEMPIVSETSKQASSKGAKYDIPPLSENKLSPVLPIDKQAPVLPGDEVLSVEIMPLKENDDALNAIVSKTQGDTDDVMKYQTRDVRHPLTVEHGLMTPVVPIDKQVPVPPVIEGASAVTPQETPIVSASVTEIQDDKNLSMSLSLPLETTPQEGTLLAQQVDDGVFVSSPQPSLSTSANVTAGSVNAERMFEVAWDDKVTSERELIAEREVVSEEETVSERLSALSSVATDVKPNPVNPLNTPRRNDDVAKRDDLASAAVIELSTENDTLSDVQDTANIPQSLNVSAARSFLQGLINDAATEPSVSKAAKEKLLTIVEGALASLSEDSSKHAVVMERTLDMLQAEGLSVRAANIAEALVTTRLVQEPSINPSQIQQHGEMAKPSSMTNDALVLEQSTSKAEGAKQQQMQAQVEQAINILKPEGQQQLAEKIRWMVNGRQSQAEIRLDPPEMGSMQIRVNVSGDSASVSIVVQNAQARELLGESMPRLRELLSDQGLQLGESFVRQGDDRERQGRQFGSFGSAGVGSDDDDSLLSNVVEQPLTRQALGGIDAYA